MGFVLKRTSFNDKLAFSYTQIETEKVELSASRDVSLDPDHGRDQDKNELST